MALIAASALPLLAILAAGATELAFVAADKSKLQGIADAAALAGANELTMASTNGVTSRTEQYALTQAARLAERGSITAEAVLVEDDRGMKLVMTGQRPSFFGDLLPLGDFRIAVTSVALKVGTAPLCVLAHGENLGTVLRMRERARLSANGCMVQANDNLRVEGSARLSAGLVQVVGDARGAISPSASIGAEVIEDPYRDRSLAPPGTCTTRKQITYTGTQRVRLAPGLHCDDYIVRDRAVLTLSPGEHYFVRSRLTVTGSGMLKGSDVVLLFDNAAFDFLQSAKVDLDGRKSGRLAGFLIVGVRPVNGFGCSAGENDDDDEDDDEDDEDEGQTGGSTCRDQLGSEFIIASNNVQNLLGVLYVPVSKLTVTGTAEINEESDWTVMVARTLEIRGSPTLVINSDYGAADVPVPSGVRELSGGVRLAR